MLASEWIRENLITKGRTWVSTHYQDHLLECENPYTNPESYARTIRLQAAKLREVDSPVADHDAVKDVVTSSDVATVEQLVDYARVDLGKFEISKVRVGTYGSEKNPNRQVRLELLPTAGKLDMRSVVDDYIRECKEYVPLILKSPPVTPESGYMYEIHIPDLHQGLLAWSKETLSDDFDIKIARRDFLESTNALLNYAKPYRPEKIILCMNGDIFNSDSIENTTTGGTRQSEDSRFQKVFTEGWQMIRDAVDVLSGVAPVELVVIGGNHDMQRSYFLGEVLRAWYSSSQCVIVDNEPAAYKYKQFGECLIAWSHGHGSKMEQLPLIMATDVPQMWAATKFREFHVGHLHTSVTKGFMVAHERPGVRVRQFNSMAPASDWTALKGYRSERIAGSVLWHKNRGAVAAFEHRI